jgi:hypothetical protein
MDLVEANKRNSNNNRRHPWEFARLEVACDLLKDYIKNDSNYTVFDIGCGDIFVVTSLSDAYPNVTFYAIDSAFTEDIILRFQSQVGDRKVFLFKSLEEAGQKLGREVDLILLMDVVEHIEKDVEFLKSLSQERFVGSETVVLITVPAFKQLFCSHDVFLGHFRRYTNRSLLASIRAGGFKMIRIGYFFSFLLFPRLLEVVKEKLSPPNRQKATTGLVEWNRGPLLTTLVRKALVLDYKWTGWLRRYTGLKLPGLSNFVIMKKNSV